MVRLDAQEGDASVQVNVCGVYSFSRFFFLCEMEEIAMETKRNNNLCFMVAGRTWPRRIIHKLETKLESE